MDVFGLRNRLVDDFQKYIRSFINISDATVRDRVEHELFGGALWPEPLIQLNPSFEPGEWIDDLVDKGLLHEECRNIFRIKPTPNGESSRLRLHRHQLDALHAARDGHNYVLTTGTGSGKSLAYIVPIVDHVVRQGSGKGIQAIVVYPMNALANSQYGELEKFLSHGYPDGQGPVRFARYTGQESQATREEIWANPPDIILTNYVMLELMLTRPDESRLIRAAQGLKFLVLDELHTYRGRQGADVALLVRRVRDQLEAKQLQCIGTSATLASGGTFAEQQAEIARVASMLFGDEVRPENVIGETLKRSTPAWEITDEDFLRDLTARVRDRAKQPPASTQDFLADPLSSWIESTFGVTYSPDAGRLVRTTPRRISGPDGAARELSELTGVPEEACVAKIQETLLAGYRHKDPETGFPVFAFRLHQFISPGDAVYASIEPEARRYVTLHGQQYVPGDRERVLLPLAFCRECGQEYYSVRKTLDPETSLATFTARDLFDRLSDDHSEAGFLYLSTTNPWPEDLDEIVARLPDDWIEEHRGQLRVRPNQRKNLPAPINVDTLGHQREEGIRCYYLPAPFRFCLNCGVAYRAHERSDFAKLTSLGFEGRSTATTILSLSAIRTLRSNESLAERARKLLTFTDNRQDASLQAGHFNDFVETGLLRGALYRAVADAGPEGLRHEELTQRVFDALDLDPTAYASNPEAKFAAAEETRRAFRNVLGYRLYRDLERGWRVTAPNLEQAGLLEIEYLSLTKLCQDDEYWQNTHEALVTASPETREFIVKTLLDHMRRELAIKVDYLDRLWLERLQQQSSQRLIAPWALDENETLEYARVAWPRPRGASSMQGHLYISAHGGFGQFLRRPSTFPNLGERLNLEETQQIINQIFQLLAGDAGILAEVQEPQEAGHVPGYQLLASAMIWKAGDGKRPLRDAIRVPREPENGRGTNPFFVEYYQTIALGDVGLEAREHTAQVPYELREEREARFREGTLPVLFCSPTMELGVDISQLNVVGMRNVPPTPANYAQRSGRAGRSGQPALVFTFCATGSPHDQFFFKRPELMVAGAVTPPRLDLANEDLIRAHVHAIWLAETGQNLHRSLRELLDLSGDDTSLPLLPEVRDTLDSPRARERALIRARRVLDTIKEELEASDWYEEGWLDNVINGAVLAFDRACDRWRSLYQAATAQRDLQNRIIADASRNAEDKKRARRLRYEAEAQIDLLTDIRSAQQSDFYSYRYFASEGFLPGYSFPRLPLSAYIPGRRGKVGHDEFLQRPRFLAISEFGPRAVIYHEGSRYRINKVILPVRDDEELTTSAVKQCEACGYLHLMIEHNGPDLCERCHQPLKEPLRQLFRLENVATRRQDRINSDEEERFRLGYEIRTGVRFPKRSDRPSWRTATVTNGDDELLTLTYASAASLWRINLGWARRKDKHRHGFLLDTERGYWARNEQMEDDPEDPMSARTARVIPYVDDTRNCLLIEFDEPPAEAVMASLQAALKTAIQVQYQLEDSEIAAEPLPSDQDRRLLLLYESAEGGAGVLRRLVDEPQALARVAEQALQICHFDPTTGADLRRAPNRSEDCEAACYDCLLSYSNQRDHPLLDRQLIKDFLTRLMTAQVNHSPSPLSRAEHLQRLKNQCDSRLEEEWLDWLDANGLALPTAAQRLIEACGTRPDFLYGRDDGYAAIYIDGPHHEAESVRQRDRDQEDCLYNLGMTVIRFGYQRDEWLAIVKRYPHIFGTVS